MIYTGVNKAKVSDLTLLVASSWPPIL